ncbi:MAG TPA: universal stress protein [Thermoanaerobaculia bacterium]|jgi:nucleotide-binding universal stress UspA family protein
MKILVPVDFNPLATAALEYACEVALRASATLIVMYADTFEPAVGLPVLQMPALATAIEESRAKTAEELAEYVNEYVDETLEMHTEVREALPVPAILAAIGEHQPDLVVMGTHGRGGLTRLLFGSVTEAVLRETKVPVLTINRIDAVVPPRTVYGAHAIADLFQPQRVADMARADLIVATAADRDLTRHARAPVLHV